MPAPLIRVQTPSDMPKEADCVVIGAGIVGVSAAYWLAKAGQRVVLLEKGLVGAEQSSRNWGWCRQQNRDARELPLSTKSLACWEEMARDLGDDMGFPGAGCCICPTTRPRSRTGRNGAVSRGAKASIRGC